MNRDTFIKELQSDSAFPIVDAEQISFLIRDFYGFVNFASSEVPHVEIWLRPNSNERENIIACMNRQLNAKTFYYVSKSVLEGKVHSNMDNSELRLELKRNVEGRIKNEEVIEDEVLSVVRNYLILCETNEIKKVEFSLSDNTNQIIDKINKYYPDAPINDKKDLVSVLLNAYKKAFNDESTY